MVQPVQFEITSYPLFLDALSSEAPPSQPLLDYAVDFFRTHQKRPHAQLVEVANSAQKLFGREAVLLDPSILTLLDCFEEDEFNIYDDVIAHLIRNRAAPTQTFLERLYNNPPPQTTEELLKMEIDSNVNFQRLLHGAAKIHHIPLFFKILNKKPDLNANSWGHRNLFENLCDSSRHTLTLEYFRLQQQLSQNPISDDSLSEIHRALLKENKALITHIAICFPHLITARGLCGKTVCDHLQTSPLNDIDSTFFCLITGQKNLEKPVELLFLLTENQAPISFKSVWNQLDLNTQEELLSGKLKNPTLDYSETLFECACKQSEEIALILFPLLPEGYPMGSESLIAALRLGASRLIRALVEKYPSLRQKLKEGETPSKKEFGRSIQRGDLKTLRLFNELQIPLPKQIPFPVKGSTIELWEYLYTISLTPLEWLLGPPSVPHLALEEKNWELLRWCIEKLSHRTSKIPQPILPDLMAYACALREEISYARFSAALQDRKKLSTAPCIFIEPTASMDLFFLEALQQGAPSSCYQNLSIHTENSPRTILEYFAESPTRYSLEALSILLTREGAENWTLSVIRKAMERRFYAFLERGFKSFPNETAALLDQLQLEELVSLFFKVVERPKSSLHRYFFAKECIRTLHPDFWAQVVKKASLPDSIPLFKAITQHVCAEKPQGQDLSFLLEPLFQQMQAPGYVTLRLFDSSGQFLREIRASAQILSKNPYFRACFEGSFKEVQEKALNLELDEDPELFIEFLRVLYGKPLEINHENATSLCKLSDFFLASEIHQKIIRWLENNQTRA